MGLYEERRGKGGGVSLAIGEGGRGEGKGIALVAGGGLDGSWFRDRFGGGRADGQCFGDGRGVGGFGCWLVCVIRSIDDCVA